MPCNHVTHRMKVKLYPDCDAVQCALLSTISPDHHVPEEFCGKCEAYTEKASPITDPLDPARPRLRKKALGLLALKCATGELPTFQNARAVPIDMKAMFHRFVAATSQESGRTLLRKMLEYQSRIKEADGGLPIEVLAARFEEIAKAEDMEDVLAALFDTVAPEEEDILGTGAESEPTP